MSKDSEYGGREGLIQPDDPRNGSLTGHRIGAAGADRLAAREEAMVMRMRGAREREGLPELSETEMVELLRSGADWSGKK